MQTGKSLLLLTIVTITLFGCQDRPQEPEMNEESQEEYDAIEVDKGEKETRESLEIELIDGEGIQVGIATLTEESDGVHIAVAAHHLPEGMHGFHIHEKGMCDTPDFESAGGHFNPGGKNHGFDDPEGPHAGDMVNLEVHADGTAEQIFINDMVTLKKDVPHSLFSEEGTTLMIHADSDDYVSQPAGDAGERIVCGVISKKEK
ncbi:superoxide dismutase family protein [Pseudogracilibacillus sp. SO30301A]|uniref:superoxide dismutase family protein n=1 Tax=Pseudogracilibacillus sp. SO30301A TaxID=3098291 RepID=UPI00300DF6AF